MRDAILAVMIREVPRTGLLAGRPARLRLHSSAMKVWPVSCVFKVRWRNGLTHLPLKQEIAGSNPVRTTGQAP
jgi:hypothetical protein